MSKQLGNFLTVSDCIERFGADATRLSLADCGDSLDDANFVEETANQAILKLTAMEDWIVKTNREFDKMRDRDSVSIADSMFENDVEYHMQSA